MTVPDATALFHDGDTAAVDLATGAWRNDTTGASGTVPKLRGLILDILTSGRRDAPAGRTGLSSCPIDRPPAIEHRGHARRRQRSMTTLRAFFTVIERIRCLR